MPLSSAYAGSAKADAKLIETYTSTLNTVILPPNEPLGAVFVPERVARHQTALQGTLKWLYGELEKGEDGTLPVPNLVEALVKWNEERAEKGEELDDLLLVMLFDPSSGLDQSIVDEAHAAGIRVVDLANLGAEILPPEPEEPEVPEPAAEAPWEGEEAAPTTPSPAEVVQDAIKAGVVAAEAAQIASAPVNIGGVTATLTFGPEFISALAVAIVAAQNVSVPGVLPETVMAEADALPGTFADPEVEHHAERATGLSAFWYNENAGRDQMYRRARGTGEGKPGEVKVWVTAEGVTKLKNLGLIK